MRGSIERMLEGAIDYAGLFPPAKLPMQGAVKRYLRYIDGPESWIVSRFVCPAGLLREFEQVVSRLQPSGAIPLTVIGTGGPDLDAFESALQADAESMTQFEESMGETCPIEAFEIRCPSNDDVETVVDDLAGFDEIDAFVEIPFGEGLQDALSAVAESDWLGAKARTGGLDAGAFPSSDQLAEFLQTCRQLDVPIKLTAGLHHPIRCFDKTVGAEAHGFLNVFGALALAEAHDLPRAEIARVLEEKDVASFVFRDDGFEWNELDVQLDSIADMRSILVGFGSCSVEEPLSELKALRLAAAGTR